MEGSEIAIISTVSNFNLYNKSSKSFPTGIKHYVIDGSNGMHNLSSIMFMFKILRRKGVKWIVMADEDVIFVKPDKIFELINYMEAEDYSVCGVRDGGEISHRNQNPYLINTFFSILHFAKVQAIFDEKEILKHQYIGENEFEDNLEKLQYQYNRKSLFEPYYCFFLWLRRKGERFLFLSASMHNDGITNKVFDLDGKLLLYHTWYARSYGKNEKHTNRINKVLKDFSLKTRTWDPLTFKDKTFTIRKNLIRFLSKTHMYFRRKIFHG